MQLIRISLLFGMLFVILIDAQAKTYKCKDEDGRVTFSQQRCFDYSSEVKLQEDLERKKLQQKKITSLESDIDDLKKRLNRAYKQGNKQINLLKTDHEEQLFRQSTAKKMIVRLDEEILLEEEARRKKIINLRKRIWEITPR